MSADNPNLSRMTYRERREQKAERLQEWSAKREQAAGAVFADHERYRGDHAFNFQPGHIPERARVIAREDRALASLKVAEDQASRAAGIERQLATSIYSDDPDAAERLAWKIAKLEAERDTIKARNAEYRKAHRAELKTMTAYQRDRAQPFPSYVTTNLSGNISRLRKRLEQLSKPPVDRIITARFDSECAECGAALSRGDQIRYNKQAGARCMSH